MTTKEEFKKIRENAWVVKRNKLNEMFLTNMTLQELRLFNVYLSIIRRNDESTRRIVFSLQEFKAIIGTKHKNINYYKGIVQQLASRSVSTDIEDGPYQICPLFIELGLNRDEHGEWYIVVDANERATPLLFGFQQEYFKYRLWNVLNLKGKNHVRMYEILKQYENIGWRAMHLSDLMGMLGIEEGRYPRWIDFKNRVLEPCKKALAQYTDILFEYEIYTKKERKTDKLKFIIIKNENYHDSTNTDKLIDLDTVEKELETVEATIEAIKETKPYGKNGLVKIREADYMRLVLEYSQAFTDRAIIKLDLYLAANKKTFPDILSRLELWIFEDVEKAKAREEERAKNQPNTNRFVNYKSRERDYDEIERMEQEYITRILGEKVPKSNKT